MPNWPTLLTSPEIVGRVNRRLLAAIARCPLLEHHGWQFRCVECHVGTGTYPRGQQAPWHHHAGYQIEIGLGGLIEFETRPRKLTLKAGEALVIPWKFPHRWGCHKPGPMLGILLDLLPSMDSVARDGWLFAEAHLLKPPTLKEEVNQLLQQAMEPSEPAFGGQMLACRLFLALSTILKPLFPKNPAPTAATAAEMRGREQVAWMIHYIEENLEMRLRVQKLADEIRVSQRQLHRLFVKHTGKSLHDFLLERRLERARQLMELSDNGMQIKEIAFKSGFGSLAYFSNTFRRAFGVSPSEFRFRLVRETDSPQKRG